ncbi:MAG: DNA mismatch repair protein MutS, partial [Cohaesibacteraceae bacterium]|nr:DNA mismatch repair protein MutS [Cohaesibacteraceae bacterium]
ISEAILSHGETLKSTAQALAVLDVSLGLARLAEEKNYYCPVVVEGYDFEIEGGRHPVVEAALEIEGAKVFVANSCNLGPTADNTNGQIWLLTGPNMAGKSTFLRQNALIAILAQMGSFVPAKSARIGIIDRLFCRVGAADDLARGRSTFMVEMVETAVILNQATPRSLVILDEIGRGTATFDGLSIAWAAVEHLHEINKSRALFATHYHEMTVLQEKLSRLENATVRVKEWKGDVVFLHEIISGAADRSYGIQVAKLAGLPGSVIVRAKEVLALLEEGDRHSPSTTLIDDLPLFSVMPRQAVSEPVKDHPALMAMKDINPDDLSPKEALDILYRVKDLVNQNEDIR